MPLLVTVCAAVSGFGSGINARICQARQTGQRYREGTRWCEGEPIAHLDACTGDGAAGDSVNYVTDESTGRHDDPRKREWERLRYDSRERLRDDSRERLRKHGRQRLR
jgi:hypothetical protein